MSSTSRILACICRHVYHCRRQRASTRRRCAATARACAPLGSRRDPLSKPSDFAPEVRITTKSIEQPGLDQPCR